MKQTIFILLALALCWGCITDREPTRTVESGRRTDRQVRPHDNDDPAQTDETTIRDLNFYLMDKAGRVVVFRYLTTTTLRFECPPGVYLMRIGRQRRPQSG